MSNSCLVGLLVALTGTSKRQNFRGNQFFRRFVCRYCYVALYCIRNRFHRTSLEQHAPAMTVMSKSSVVAASSIGIAGSATISVSMVTFTSYKRYPWEWSRT